MPFHRAALACCLAVIPALATAAPPAPPDGKATEDPCESAIQRWHDKRILPKLAGFAEELDSACKCVHGYRRLDPGEDAGSEGKSLLNGIARGLAEGRRRAGDVLQYLHADEKGDSPALEELDLPRKLSPSERAMCGARASRLADGLSKKVEAALTPIARNESAAMQAFILLEKGSRAPLRWSPLDVEDFYVEPAPGSEGPDCRIPEEPILKSSDELAPAE